MKAVLAGLCVLVFLAWGGAFLATGGQGRFIDQAAINGNTLATDTLAPPIGVDASGGGSVALSWTATSDSYASGHRILRATSSGGPYSQIAQVTPRTTTAYVDNPSNGTYYYVIRAYFQNWESVDSSQVAASVGSANWLATGSYTGNGLDNRAITAIGFRPDVVIVNCDCGQLTVVRTSTMAGDTSKPISNSGVLQADQVQSLDVDGFTVGTSARVNRSGDTYYWTAMKAGSYLQVGSYTGNGLDNRSISGVGFSPAWVMTLGDGEESWFRPAGASGDASYRLEGLGDFTDRIQVLEADGFQVGSHANANSSGVSFHYIAWKASSGVVKASSYTGDNVDNRSVTGVGFQPAFVWVKRNVNSASTWRPGSASGDLAFIWDGAGSANNIQALESDSFQIGTHARVNANGGTYYYLALKDSP